MVGRDGMVDNFQRGYGKLGTVELVEPGSAVVDERRVGRGLEGVCPDKIKRFAL